MLELIEHKSALPLSILLGAVSHMLSQLSTARKNAPPMNYDWVDTVIALVTGLFSGVLFTVAAYYVSGDETVTLIVGPIGAFLGLTGLNKVGAALLDTVLTRFAKAELDLKENGK